MTEKEFHQAGYKFLENAFSVLENRKFRLKPHWSIDHICYRTESAESYQGMCEKLKEFSQLLVESEVNGRMISTFKLNEPIVFEDKIIDLVEVPSPKPENSYRNGFEHFEVVCDSSFTELKYLYKNFPFDEKGSTKEFNPELEFNFDRFSVKFHQQSLQSVIELEKNQRIFAALLESRVLTLLKKYQPAVAGTFPLGIGQEESDLDILISHYNLEEVEEVLQKEFSHLEGFKVERSELNEQKSVIANFSVNQVPFEVVAQETLSFKQRAYQHFQIEERLLKIHGEALKNSILKIREKGEKTEPAFAKALGLEGDAYLKLLRLHKVESDIELEDIEIVG